jgi:hypothetical protein
VVCLWSFCKYRVLPLRHGVYFVLLDPTIHSTVPRYIKRTHPLYVVVFATRTPAYNHIIPLIQVRLYRLYIFQNIAHWDTTRASKCVFKHTTLNSTISSRPLSWAFSTASEFTSNPCSTRVGVAWSTSRKHAQDTPCAYPPRSIHPYDPERTWKDLRFSLLSRLSTNEILAYFAHSPIDRRHDIRRMSTYNQNMNARVDYPKCQVYNLWLINESKRICASVCSKRVSTDR